MRSIGIDLGEDSVKIVELLQNKKTVIVQSVFEKKLSSESSPQDRELEAIEFVRSVLARNDFSGARFCMALRQDKVTVRTKTFPFSDRIKIQKSLSFELEEDIPFDPDAAVEHKDEQARENSDHGDGDVEAALSFNNYFFISNGLDVDALLKIGVDFGL